jgi:CRISPR-associated endonuclease Cas1
MQSQPTTLKPRDGLLVLSGYGIRISVDRRHLAVSDGVGRDRRTGALHRATSGLRRLVVIAQSGFISLEAIRWLSDVGASYVQIGRDGELVACYSPLGVNDARLRRAQALATTTEVGLGIAKRLITEKLLAQQSLLEGRGFKSVVGPIAQAREFVNSSVNAEELRWCEATAATVYWNALSATPMAFVRAELRRVPAHWLVFGSRHSTLTNNTRKATSPTSALLNYLYAILESETRIELLAKGLDPEIGIFHSVQRFRNSLAHDVMEPVRPEVDGFVLELLATRVFAVADFVETREGSCRLAPDLARILANTAPRWAARVRPIVATMALELEHTAASPKKTGAREVGRFPGMLQRRTRGGGSREAHTSPAPRCRECGASISRARYAKCLACDQERREHVAPHLGGRAVLAGLRAAGTDPAHGGQAGGKRSAIAIQRHAEALAATGRERITSEERDKFRHEVLPLLSNVTVGTLSRVTSLSKTYCSFIKRGLSTPHPRHWRALKRLTTTGSARG